MKPYPRFQCNSPGRYCTIVCAKHWYLGQRALAAASGKQQYCTRVPSSRLCASLASCQRLLAFDSCTNNSRSILAAPLGKSTVRVDWSLVSLTVQNETGERRRCQSSARLRLFAPRDSLVRKILASEKKNPRHIWRVKIKKKLLNRGIVQQYTTSPGRRIDGHVVNVVGKHPVIIGTIATVDGTCRVVPKNSHRVR